MRARVRFDTEGQAFREQARRSDRCGKLAYVSKKEAKARAKAQTRFSGEYIEAYHCFACHCYHIGHPPAPYDPSLHRLRDDAC